MKIIYSISRVMNYVAMGLLTILMLLIVSDVLLRFVFNSPITGTPEMAAMIMVCLVLGTAWCATKGGHVSVDLVMNRFPLRVQAIVDSITLFASMVMCAIIIWQAFIVSLWELRFGYTASNVFKVPTFPFWWLYILGCVLLFLVIVTLVIQKAKGFTKG